MHALMYTDYSKDVSTLLSLQKKSHYNNPVPSYKERLNNLEKLECLLLENKELICQAISKDFGNRPRQETLLLELFLTIDGIRDCRKNLKKWMKPKKRKVSLWFCGARNKVIPQPKGVVGVIAPWNYPLFLVFGPVTGALAAGNRCMVKMAANSHHLCILLEQLVSEYFPKETLAIVPNVSGSIFSSLPFDHLVFTGSAKTGRHVMRAAAENLTPVTLELGGKSPVLISNDFDLRLAARRILQMKTVNAGQTCVAPDYVFVPEDRLDTFVAYCKEITSSRYLALDCKDYTSIVDEEAYARLVGYLEQAHTCGAEIISLFPGEDKNDSLNKIAPHLVINANENMLVMQEEIFGPILPVLTYRSLDDAIDFIKKREKPLALYLFSNSCETQNHVISSTQSGGVSLNDCGLHVAQHDLPFGGVGESGMGHYHGYEGFLELSKLRPIFVQSRFDAIKLLYPPYGKIFDRIMNVMLRTKL